MLKVLWYILLFEWAFSQLTIVFFYLLLNNILSKEKLKL